jgi:hypothetical protein|tara:strand:+ start:138 stop:383 length:246 start_codon:yes stop_codon:yes gene_type:complete
MSWEKIIKNIEGDEKEFDRNLRELEVSDGHLRRLRDMLVLDSEYTPTKEQVRLFKANRDYYIKLFDEISKAIDSDAYPDGV